jgi:NTE family protein
MPNGRALVLGGGGVTGIAWETGLLAGLAEAGIDLPSADLVAGCDGVVVVAPITFALRRRGRTENQLADSVAAVWT